MNLPNHLRADIRDGMNPTLVLAIYCCTCEDYIGQRSDFEELGEGDEVECTSCAEPEPTEEELWDFKRRVFKNG